MPQLLKKILSWSFSRYSTYKQCPARAKYLYLDKLKEPKSTALERGGHIHELAEKYIKGELKTLPAELKLFKADFTFLKNRYKSDMAHGGVIVEDDWALTKDWVQTRWDDWANCWLRLKLDAAHVTEAGVLIITDWKTGKFRPAANEDYLEQLQLYALVAMTLLPHINEVRPRNAYLDIPERPGSDKGFVFPAALAPIIYTRADLPSLKKTWLKRTKPMLNDQKFAPRPNDKCKWCHFSASKAGPCQF